MELGELFKYDYCLKCREIHEEQDRIPPCDSNQEHCNIIHDRPFRLYNENIFATLIYWRVVNLSPPILLGKYTYPTVTMLFEVIDSFKLSDSKKEEIVSKVEIIQNKRMELLLERRKEK